MNVSNPLNGGGADPVPQAHRQTLTKVPPPPPPVKRKAPIMPEGDTPWLHSFFADVYARSPYHRGRGPGTVYCFTEGHGLPVKLGYSANAIIRYQAMQIMTWRPLYICWAVDGTTFAHESAFKHLLRDTLVRGEWFNDADDSLKHCLPQAGGTRADLEAVIEARAKAMGYPPNRWPRRPRVYGTTLFLLQRKAAA